jgi:uncharacterized protein YndB with AHSA1/START domain
MPDIFHDFIIKAPAQKVFQAISTPQGLDEWWTKSSFGEPRLGSEYELGFGPGHDCRAVVARCVPGAEFELQLTQAHEDWQGTRVALDLEQKEGFTQVRFHHSGWPDNEHYRGSCYCWAMYLRILKRYVEYGETVPYEQRLEV